MPPALHEFRVVTNERVASDLFRLVIEAPELAASLQPGQFMNLAVPGDASHILRVPLSFARTQPSSGTVELIYAVVGEGTERLSRLKPDDRSSAVGPSGKGWRLPQGPGRVLLVGGGAGLPPILAAAYQLAATNVGFDAVVGARDAAHLFERGVDELRGLTPHALCDCGRRVLVTTDDGSAGIHGLATLAVAQLLAERPYDCIMTCGAAAMMRGVAQLAAEHGVPCQVSTEQLMGCGFGACSCCNIALAEGGYALCCQDGPVFDAEVIAWQTCA